MLAGRYRHFSTNYHEREILSRTGLDMSNCADGLQVELIYGDLRIPVAQET